MFLCSYCKTYNITSAFCDPGYYFNGTNCSPCVRGYYKDNMNRSATECTQCEPNNTTETTASETSADCSLRMYDCINNKIGRIINAWVKK